MTVHNEIEQLAIPSHARSRLSRLRLIIPLALAGFVHAFSLAAACPDLFDAGPAQATDKAGLVTLSNRAIEAAWQSSGGVLKPVSMTDRIARKPLPAPDSLFVLTILEGGVITSSSLKTVSGPKVEILAGDPNASRLSERYSGRDVVAELEDPSTGLHATWRAILRDGSSYLRQEVILQAGAVDVRLGSVRLIDLRVPGARIVGAVKGSPAVVGNVFYGFEHPLSETRLVGDRLLCRIMRELPLRAGQRVTYSSVIGVTPLGQLRRGFLNYIERERAHPYRPFLHYNSWYDIGYFSKYDEAAALDVVNSCGRELVEKRGVKLDSFLFDDGWDDNTTLWSFHKGFPNGLTPVRAAAAKFGAAPGIWLSPWGGYGEPRQERLKYGRQQGFETNEGGFALSGPKYFARFRETTLEFITRCRINQFKIDGTGNVDSAIKGSDFDSDFHAAISLIGEWRRVKPDIYVNLTTGTYPSPFWLQYADSIWRGGEDHSFAGVGTNRQKWITYRDADTYEGVVQAGPLYPLNSLMLHGLIYARHARNLNTDPQGDFESEVRSYFGTGTQLQEMYVSPSLLKGPDWDVIAESAKWARANADVLVDSHWIGGDPVLLEVYGWASWSPRKGIIVLRNPSDKPQTFSLDIEKAFELPDGAARVYRARSPWAKDKDQPAISLLAGRTETVTLKPFQVIVWDAVPL